MVIRCSNCNSAYAVNDSKVKNKKFAFNCPNCSAENIIDNRGPVANAVATGGDPSADMGKDNLSPNMEFQEQEESAVLTDDSASTELSQDTDIMGESEVEFDDKMMDSLGDEAEELAKDFTSDEMKSTIVDEPLGESMESSIEEPIEEPIEETIDETIVDSVEDIDEENTTLDLDSLDIDLDEEPALETGDELASEVSIEDESLPEIPDLDDISSEEDIVAHEESLDLSDAEDLDLSLDDDTLPTDESIMEPEAEIQQESLDGIDDELDLDFDIEDVSDVGDDIDLDFTLDEEEELESPQVVQDELELTDEPGIADSMDDMSDIDAMTDDLENEIIDESETLADLDDLQDVDTMTEDLNDDIKEEDIMEDLDDLPDIDTLSENTLDEVEEDTDIIGDLDDLPDIDSMSDELNEEIESTSEEVGELNKKSKIDTILDEMPLGMGDESGKAASDFEPVEDEIIDIDPDFLSEDSLVSVEGEDSVPGIDDIASAEVFDEEDEDDERITIDLDSLDIEFEEDDEIAQGETLEEDLDIDLPENVEEELEIDIPENVEEELEIDIPESVSEMDEEDTTLDLDSLDIEIDEDHTELSEGEIPDHIIPDESTEASELDQVSALDSVDEDEDESITIDLDSLDIPVVESDDVFTGETLDEEDEKITLEDAGLTIEELTSEEAVVASSLHDDNDEEDIKLTIDEIDPSLNVDNIEDELTGSVSAAESSFQDEVLDEDLIDLDHDEEFKEYSTDKDEILGSDFGTHVDDKLIELDESELRGKEGKIKSKKEMIHKVTRGSVNFSIDYSLKYSRIRALLRLFGLYFIGLIPHFIVYFIYNLLSLILGFLNQVIIFTTGSNIEDFSEIQENTIRYLLSISATFTGIIDELPIFAGREDIDYPLQLDITYPLRYSKVIAAIRLSVVGIFIINIPHWIILGLLTLAMPVIALIGILSVIVSGRWPHFLFDIITRYYRYFAKILAFTFGLVDSYPPFNFK